MEPRTKHIFISMVQTRKAGGRGGLQSESKMSLRCRLKFLTDCVLKSRSGDTVTLLRLLCIGSGILLKMVETVNGDPTVSLPLCLSSFQQWEAVRSQADVTFVLFLIYYTCE